MLDSATDILDELNGEGLCQTSRDLVLGFPEIVEIGVEPLGPKMSAPFRLDQLDVYAHPVTSPSHAPFKDIANAKFLADLLRIDRFALVGECGVARDYEASGDPR